MIYEHFAHRVLAPYIEFLHSLTFLRWQLISYYNPHWSMLSQPWYLNNWWVYQIYTLVSITLILRPFGAAIVSKQYSLPWEGCLRVLLYKWCMIHLQVVTCYTYICSNLTDSTYNQLSGQKPGLSYTAYSSITAI